MTQTAFDPDGMYGGIPYKVLNAGQIEALISGGIVRFKTMEQFLAVASEGVTPASDVHATNQTPAHVASRRSSASSVQASKGPMMRIAIILIGFVLGIGIIAYFTMAASDGPDQATLARLLARQNECASLMSDMTRLGVLKRVVQDAPNNTFVYVDDITWNAQSTNDRLTQSLTVYCAITPASGYLTVTVRNMQGENVFRIRNGHVVPWF
jgi:hypothetical protein